MYADLSTNLKTRLVEENNWVLYTIYYIFYKFLPPTYKDIVNDFGVYILHLLWTMLCWPMQAVKRLATGWTVRGGFPHTSRLTLGPTYRVFLSGVKRPGLGVNHQSLSSAEVKERVQLHLYSASGASLSVLGGTLPYLRQRNTLLNKYDWCVLPKDRYVHQPKHIAVTIIWTYTSAVSWNKPYLCITRSTEVITINLLAPEF
jgi:hypothetical protein